ncbi:MAG: 3-hexulose-6-phosphate synthase [Erysipelotrichaceae bacterium]|nr:3-hexulose-6-phosphate synthase [Erysipelotrichaceae bacterium]
MQLQVALDTLTIEQSLALLEKTGELVDIVEVGTPFIMEYGMEAVRRIRERFPALTVLADTKIADGAKIETASAVRAGADIVTVLAVSEDATIRDCIDEAHKHGVMVLVDMIAVKDLEERTGQIEDMGADYICVHNGYDTQNTVESPLDELIRIRKTVKKAKVAVAGGIKLSTLPEIVREKPDLVIVGGAITGSSDPANMCRKIREML